jgi:hypothetical protein
MSSSPRPPERAGTPRTDPPPSEVSNDERPGELPDGDERFVEEELPADFWGEESPAHPSERSGAAHVGEPATTNAKDPGRSRSGSSSNVAGGASGTVGGARATDGEVARARATDGEVARARATENEVAGAAAIEGEAFATLQLLFPGKVVAIESPVDADEAADEGSGAGPEAGAEAEDAGEPADPYAEG